MKKNRIQGFACVSESGVQFRKRLGDLTPSSIVSSFTSSDEANSSVNSSISMLPAHKMVKEVSAIDMYLMQSSRKLATNPSLGTIVYGTLVETSTTPWIRVTVQKKGAHVYYYLPTIVDGKTLFIKFN